MSTPISGETDDQLAISAAIQQSFGGINRSKTGIDPQVLIVGAVVIAAFYFLSKRRK